MKKCPTCQKTYDDNLKFCQTDGTLLVVDAPPADPYATMVASKDEILSSIPSNDAPKNSPFGSADDDLLDIPEDNDLGKTMVVSEAERKDMFETPSSNPIPPPSFGQDDFAVEDKRSSADTLLSQPEPPKFNEPDLSPPSFGDLSSSSSNEPNSPFGNQPPTFNDSPFSSDFDQPKREDNNPFNTPIPSPFDQQMPPSYNAPTTPPFEPPSFKIEEAKAEALNTPFAEEVSHGNQAVADSSWTPPVVQEQNWGNQNFGQNAPVQQTPAGAQGENKTLAFVALGLGIVSVLCCGGNIVCGIPAIIVGFMARSKEAADPKAYAGGNLALIGMILGGLSIVIFVLLIIFQLFLGGLPFLIG